MNAKTAWGGEFRGAWEAMAAATPRRRRTSSANAFPLYTTAELLRMASSNSCDEPTRAKIEAEITRRQSK